MDAQGAAVAASANAGEWLSLMPDATEVKLSLPVHSVGFAAIGRPGEPAVLRVRLANGRWPRCTACATNSISGTVSVIISSPDVAQLSPVVAAVYGLSSREQQVVDLVLHGLATQRIARGLHVSAYTVQEHLRHIFVKVGVASRGELVASLFLGTRRMTWASNAAGACVPLRAQSGMTGNLRGP
jgi:DNA-binding CsgD family transcriptional regulator